MRMRLEGSMGSKAKFSQRIDVPGTADTPENLQGGVLLVFRPALDRRSVLGSMLQRKRWSGKSFLALAGASP